MRHHIAVVALCVGLVLTAAACTSQALDTTGHSITPAISSAPSTGHPTTSAPAVKTKPKPKYVLPSKANVKLTIKVLTKDCFGEAGCNVTYQMKVAQTVPAGSFDPGVTYDVTYEVRGVEDGPQVGTLKITGDSYSADEQEFASTSSQSKKLTAVITDVEAE